MEGDPIAILYYGIKLGDEDPMEGEEENDYHGANDAWAKMNGPKEPEDSGDYRGPQWDTWREALKAYKDSPIHVEIDWSGSDCGQSFYVHCPCLEKNVEWDNQLDLGRDFLLGANPEADQYIADFCEKFGIVYKTPSWHLACLYF